MLDLRCAIATVGLAALASLAGCEAESAAPPAAVAADSKEGDPAEDTKGEQAQPEEKTSESAGQPDPQPEPEPEPPKPPEPQTVLLVGDSMIATGIGVLLEKKLDAHVLVTAHRKGKSASGLARPDFYDWMDEAKKQVEAHDPDLTIVIVGGNDGQDLTPSSKAEKRTRWKTEEWEPAYKARVSSFLTTLAGEEDKVLWLGLPKMGLGSLERKLVLIRSVQQEAVKEFGDRAVYFETSPFLTDENGDLLRQVIIKGKYREVREDDGIHFTMAGSQFFVDSVYPTVLETLGLEDSAAYEKEEEPEAADGAPSGDAPAEAKAEQPAPEPAK